MQPIEAIKELRTRQGLSQQAFAVRMGLAIRTVARYEAGGSPRHEILEQFIHEANRAGFPDVADALAELSMKLLEERSARVELAKMCIRLVIGQIENRERDERWHGKPLDLEGLTKTLHAAVTHLSALSKKSDEDAD